MSTSHSGALKSRASSKLHPKSQPSVTTQGLLPRPVLIALLLATNGFLLAATLVLSRKAQALGITPISFGFWMSVGAALLLALYAGRHMRDLANRRMVTFGSISGLTSLAIPQLIMFTVLSHIGAGLASLVYALPVLLTFLFARMLGLEGKNGFRMAGALIGTFGATLLLMPTEGGLPTSALPWMALALLVPVILASGNIYRAVAWPVGAKPQVMAATTLGTSVIVFALAGLAFGVDFDFTKVDGVWPFIAVQSFVSAGQFLAYFALQRVAPPVIFSLIGQMTLLFGLPMGAAFLGETYTVMTFVAVGLMALGLVGVVGGPVFKARLQK